MAKDTPYLDVQQLTKSFGSLVLFENISFSIAGDGLTTVSKTLDQFENAGGVLTWTLTEDRVVAQLTARLVPTCLEKRLLSDGSYEELPTAPCNDFNASVLPRLSDEESNALPELRGVPRRSNFGRGTSTPQLQDVADGKLSLEAFVSVLPDEDLARLLGGQPNVGLANTFGYGNNVVYGVPNVMTADGPAGVRINPGLGVTTTAFPCATLLASTWDPQVTWEVGAACALEAKENNIQVWLAPGVNIHRNPLCGRNFEYFSEDPFLSGKIAAAYVLGIQSNGVGTSIKHFAANNQETNRYSNNSQVSERAMREIYLRGFEIAVKESQPHALMTSYNLLNGTHTSERRDLIEDILRCEFGFQGMVMSDWIIAMMNGKDSKYPAPNAAKIAAAGNDLTMPGGKGDFKAMLKGLRDGLVTRRRLAINATRVYRMAKRLTETRYGKTGKEQTVCPVAVPADCETVIVLPGGKQETAAAGGYRIKE